MHLLSRTSTHVEAHEDYGFFGPDSVTWKVWSYPTSLTIGSSASVVVEEFDPALIAAVDATQAIFDRPRTRYDRTLAVLRHGGLRRQPATSKAAAILLKFPPRASGSSHERQAATTPTTLTPSSGSTSPPGTRSSTPTRSSARGAEPEEEAQYWQECAIAAELQTCSPDDVPRSREGIQEYFAYMRPRLAGSDAAQRMMAHLLRAEIMLPPVPVLLRPAQLDRRTRPSARARLATMPRWMRSHGRAAPVTGGRRARDPAAAHARSGPSTSARGSSCCCCRCSRR